MSYDIQIQTTISRILITIPEKDFEIHLDYDKKGWTNQTIQGGIPQQHPERLSIAPWGDDWARGNMYLMGLEKIGIQGKEAKDILQEINRLIRTKRDEWEEIEKQDMKGENNGRMGFLTIQPHFQEAKRILEKEDPLKYIVTAIAQRHIGDTNLIRALLLSYPALLVHANGDRFIIGESGHGKTDACQEASKIFPTGIFESFVGSSRLAKIYALKENPLYLDQKIIYNDDTAVSDPEHRRFMRAIEEARKGEKRYYETVEKQKPVKIQIQGEYIIWESAVNPPGDIQDASRRLICPIEENDEHKREIVERTKELVGNDLLRKSPEEYNICKAILYLLKQQHPPGVVIPYHKRIEGLEGGRANKAFMGLIKAHACLNHMQREKDENGKISATIEDFQMAKEIYESLQPKQNLTKTDEEILTYLRFHEIDDDPFKSCREITEFTRVSRAQVYRRIKILHKRGVVDGEFGSDSKRYTTNKRPETNIYLKEEGDSGT